MRRNAELLVAKGLEGINRAILDDVAEVVRDLHPDHVWTAKMVGERMVAAVKLCQRIGGRVGPSDKSGNWPTILREWADLMAQVETDEIGKDKEPRRYTPTAREVSQMDQAVGWIGRYLAGPEHDAMRRVLALWLRSKVTRAAFSEILKRKKWSKATAYRVRDRALLIIALRLMREGVQP